MNPLKELTQLVVMLFVPLGAVLAVCTLVVWLLLTITAPSLSERRQTFHDWIRATSNTNLSFEEFERLKAQHLLPGQGRPPEVEYQPIVIPIYQ